MQCKIDRVSYRYRSVLPGQELPAPCEEAYRATYPRGGPYHDVVEAWFVDINTLDALLALSAKYGDLILSACLGNADIPEITIYDDHLE